MTPDILQFGNNLYSEQAKYIFEAWLIPTPHSAFSLWPQYLFLCPTRKLCNFSSKLCNGSAGNVHHLYMAKLNIAYMGIFYKKTDNQKLLQQSVMLCQSVEPYIDELGLDWNVIRNLRQEIRAMQNIIAQYISLPDSFAEVKMHGIRVAIQLLIHQCIQSINYTEDLGMILGIESNSRFNSNNFFGSGYSLNYLN